MATEAEAEIVKSYNEMVDLMTAFDSNQDSFTEEGEYFLGEIDFRLDSILAIAPRFCQLHNRLKRSQITEQIKEELDNLRKRFDIQHPRLVGRFRQWISLHKPPPLKQEEHHRPRTKLPQLPQPSFDGNADNWLSFRDSFESIIHKSQHISIAEKYDYLRKALSSIERNVLRNHPESDDFYEQAWTAVKDRYDDPRKFKARHFNDLFTVKRMSSDSPDEVRRIYDDFSSHVMVLNQLNATFDDMLVHIVQFRMDPQTLRDWLIDLGDKEPTWKIISEFLIAHWRRLDRIQQPLQLAQKKPLPVKSVDKTQTKTKSTKVFTSSESASLSQVKCTLCNASHLLWRCEKFRTLSIRERSDHVKNNRLCRNCLSCSHALSDCKSTSRCKLCNRNHHTMLHYENAAVTNIAGSSSRVQDTEAQQSMSSAAEPFKPFPPVKVQHGSSNFNGKSASLHAIAKKQTLLSTAVFDVFDVHGDLHECRALLDSGSESDFITEKFARQLQLPLGETYHAVSGIGGSTEIIRHYSKVTFSSRYGFYQDEIVCAITSEIASHLPNSYYDVRDIKIPDGCFLADPTYNHPLPVDMILGNTVFFQSLLEGKILIRGGPILQHFKFGWVMNGFVPRVSEEQSKSLSSFTFFGKSDNESIDEKLERFMELDQFENNKKLLSPEEQYCEKTFQETTYKDDDGRYVVQFPFKEDIAKLESNYQKSLSQFYAQEKARENDPELNLLYCAYMQTLIEQNIMTETDPTNIKDGFYLPHHGVKKATSTTTKVRPVFNGSSRDVNGLSLNDCLCVGSKVQPDSFDILIRFREKPYVIKGDVEKMYLQVAIDPSQRKYQKLLWRFNSTVDLKHFELNRVTFGLASSAFHATRVLTQIAHDMMKQFPQAAKLILDSTFVDDCIAGVSSVEEGRKLLNQIRYMLSSSCMPIRKWAANDEQIIKDILPHDLEPIEDETTSIRTLGHNWFPKTDKLSLTFKAMKEGKVTKTSVMSETAGLHDPLGYIGPFVFKAKLFMKELCTTKMQWTQEPKQDFTEKWNEFRKHIPALNDIVIDRNVLLINPVRIELHGFCDASEAGYGAVIFIRSLDMLGNVQVSLLCSKSRVSPPKRHSTARLELCAALLLAKLTTKIMAITTIKFSAIVLWSDSMISLYWIISQSSELSVFVGNRVAKIQDLTTHFIWKHIPGKINPADPLSRGLTAHELMSCSLWWNGPDFLSLDSSHWPQSRITINGDEPEYTAELRKSSKVLMQSISFMTFETKFMKYIETRSRLQFLIRTFAYILRFSHNATPAYRRQSDIRKGLLSVEEIEMARNQIIIIIQKTIYPREYQYLLRVLEDPSTTEEFPRTSPILSLSPVMSKDDYLIRVGGRLDACTVISTSQKHPIILPESQFARIILRDIHKKNLHSGVLSTLNISRQEFWIIRAKSMVKQVIHECIICFRAKPKFATQIMGSLPAARVTMTPPFYTTAVDYAGYFNLRSSMTHRATIVKAYVAMFKCMSTGAIHLELVTSLSTQAFIAAFDRFVSRRGLCSQIFSDNGTNFVGACSEFNSIYATIEKDVGTHLIDKRIKWTFTIPLAPHAGGYYESGIKAMKHHLIRVMENRSFDYEQFSTILTKIEAIVNSRPLTPMSDDPSDHQALTPAHFLIGRTLIAKPERNLRDIAENRVDKWNKLQQLQQQFWNLWYNEYLNELQKRPIHFRQKNIFRVGDMVIIKDANLPPLKWLVGRISEVFPGNDNIIRNVTVRTIKNNKEFFYKRHIRYLCFLPCETTSFIAAGVCSGE